jgi:hypothetical protein
MAGTLAFLSLGPDRKRPESSSHKMYSLTTQNAALHGYIISRASPSDSQRWHQHHAKRGSGDSLHNFLLYVQDQLDCSCHMTSKSIQQTRELGAWQDFRISRVRWVSKRCLNSLRTRAKLGPRDESNYYIPQCQEIVQRVSRPSLRGGDAIHPALQIRGAGLVSRLCHCMIVVLLNA